MATTLPSSSPALERVASRWQIVGLAVNDVIGSGVYLLPAAAAALLGPASLWAVILAALAVALVALCFAEASSHFDEPGGAYLYARTAFGDLVGFEVGWMTWLARVASLASLSVGFAQALSYFHPALGHGSGRVLVVVITLTVLTAINYVGVRFGVDLAVFLAVSKVLPLILFVGVGLAVASPRLAASQAATRTDPTGGWAHLGEAALLLLFAYAGFENTPAPAGEFKNPRRDVPFALLAHLVLVTLLYVGVQWVALGTVPGLAASETPLADGARLFLGRWGGWVLTVGAALSILGTTGNTVLAGPRYLFALARDGYGPALLARVHPRFHTPAAALLTQTAVALPLALSGTFVGLAALSVVARLATYAGTAAAVPVLRRKLGGASGSGEARTFRLPGGRVIPTLAILLTLGLAASATWKNLLAAAVALAVGAVIYALRRQPSTPSVQDGQKMDR